MKDTDRPMDCATISGFTQEQVTPSTVYNGVRNPAVRYSKSMLKLVVLGLLLPLAAACNSTLSVLFVARVQPLTGQRDCMFYVDGSLTDVYPCQDGLRVARTALMPPGQVWNTEVVKASTRLVMTVNQEVQTQVPFDGDLCGHGSGLVGLYVNSFLRLMTSPDSGPVCTPVQAGDNVYAEFVDLAWIQPNPVFFETVSLLQYG